LAPAPTLRYDVGNNASTRTFDNRLRAGYRLLADQPLSQRNLSAALVTFKDYWLMQIDVHRHMVTAWIAHAHGKREEALQMLQTAADREEAIERDPVVPVPIISARELLGEILLETNQPQQALSAFAASLKEKPGRFWSLWGGAGGEACRRPRTREVVTDCGASLEGDHVCAAMISPR